MAEARSGGIPGTAPDKQTIDLPRLLANRLAISAPEPATASADTAPDNDLRTACAPADNIDIEILEWIVSHARRKRHPTRSSH
jgi:hypothetical protein